MIHDRETPPLRRRVRQLGATKDQASLRGGNEARDRFHERSLPCPGGTDDDAVRALRYLERDVLQVEVADTRRQMIERDHRRLAGSRSSPRRVRSATRGMSARSTSTAA